MGAVKLVRRLGLALLVLAALSGASAAPASALQGLTLGFNVKAFGDQSTSAAWLNQAVGERSGTLRINALWSTIAPRQPASPADPADPAYHWAELDQAVRGIAARGIPALLTFYDAPAWAEGPGRPAVSHDFPRGSWRPNAGALKTFSVAAARRYSGSYPDPAQPGAVLPRVRYWQAWNEPNLWLYVTPQWTGGPGNYQLASPGIYRTMLNNVYAGVKSVDSSNVVVAAGTAPYGDPQPGGLRVTPVKFTRSLLCLSGGSLRRLSCPDPAHLDVIDHHPYGLSPTAHAALKDDVAITDMGRLTRVLRAAERSGRVLPRGHKRVWATEVSWDSSPPDPGGVPIARQARWIEQTDYLLWRQGVDTVLWLQIRDAAPLPSYATSYQSGVFYANGRAKPSALAFRFPFVLTRVRATRFTAWGKAPQAGSVAIQRRAGSGWHTIRRLSAGSNHVFQTRLTLKGRPTLRAVSAGQASYPWSVGGG